jgi:hypothetical protein
MITVGTRVSYHGSLDDLWGRYRVAAVDPDAVDGPRYELADPDGTTSCPTSATAPSSRSPTAPSTGCSP